MSATTPISVLPYPDPGDPVTRGADDIRALAEALDTKIGQRGSAVVTTNSGGGYAINYPRPFAAAPVVVLTPGDGPPVILHIIGAQNSNAGFGGVITNPGGSPVQGTLRVNWSAAMSG